MSKTIVITGSTDGIGKLTALKLAKQQHKIYVHGRNKAKLKEVISFSLCLACFNYANNSMY